MTFALEFFIATAADPEEIRVDRIYDAGHFETTSRVDWMMGVWWYEQVFWATLTIAFSDVVFLVSAFWGVVSSLLAVPGSLITYILFSAAAPACVPTHCQLF